MDIETEVCKVAQAKTVILATGGSGRLHFQDFPLPIIMAPLPTVLSLLTAPESLWSFKILCNIIHRRTFSRTALWRPCNGKGAFFGSEYSQRRGEPFVNPPGDQRCGHRRHHPRMKANGARAFAPVWAVAFGWTFPMIEKKRGAGAIEKYLPAMFRMFRKK